MLAGFDQSGAFSRLSSANLSQLMKVYFSLEGTSEALLVLARGLCKGSVFCGTDLRNFLGGMYLKLGQWKGHWRNTAWL
jgi:hypothetical protein